MSNAIPLRGRVLAYAALNQIRSDPQHWDQTSWIGESECGTTACFAGRVVMMAGIDLDTPAAIPRSIQSTAIDLLGLVDDDVIHPLFQPSNTLEDLESLVVHYFGVEEM